MYFSLPWLPWFHGLAAFRFIEDYKIGEWKAGVTNPTRLYLSHYSEIAVARKQFSYGVDTGADFRSPHSFLPGSGRLEDQYLDITQPGYRLPGNRIADLELECNRRGDIKTIAFEQRFDKRG